MRLSARTLALAGILGLIIGAGLLLLNNSDEGDTEEIQIVEDNVPLFPELVADDVATITITTSTQAPDADEEPTETETVYMRSVGGEWTVNGELAGGVALTETANLIQADVNTALNTLVNLVATEQFESDDLAEFDLDPPSTIVELQTGDETFVVRFGATNPQNTRYYALLGDDTATVYLLTDKTSIDTVLEYGEAPPLEPIPTPTAVPVLSLPGPLFIDPSAAATITELRVQDNEAEAEVVLSRATPADPWMVMGPDGDEAMAANEGLMSLYTSVFFGLNAVDGLPADDLAALALDMPRFTITAVFGTGQTATLQVGDTDPSGSRIYTLFNDFEEVAVLPVDDVGILTDIVAQPPLQVLEDTTAEMTAEATADVEVTAEATSESTEEPEATAEATAD